MIDKQLQQDRNLCNDFIDHMPSHIGQSESSAAVKVCQFFVIYAQ